MMITDSSTLGRSSSAVAAKTVSVFAIMICAGLLTSTISATMLELQTRVQVTIDRAALLVAWLYLGRLPGTLAASLVFDRAAAAELALVASAALTAVLVGAVPWCDGYASLSVVVGLIGACIGFSSVGVNRVCFTLWSEPTVRSIIQCLNFFFAIGCSIAPLLVNHFVDDRVITDDAIQLVPEYNNHTINTTDVASNVPTVLSAAAANYSANKTADLKSEYQLYKPFAVISGLQLVAGAALLAVHLTFDCWRKRRQADQLQTSFSTATADQVDEAAKSALDVEITRSNSLVGRKYSIDAMSENVDAVTSLMRSSVDGPATPTSSRRRLIRPLLSTLFSVYFLSHANVEVTYGSLVLPYCVHRLSMSESTGNRVAFSFLISTAVGRFVGIFVSRLVVPDRQLTASLIVAVASLSALTALQSGSAVADPPSATETFSVWPCSVTLGLAVSSVFPSTVSLASRYVGVSSPLLALLVASFSVGSVVGPASAGALFRRLGPVWFVRYSLGASLLTLVLFVIIRVVYVVYSSRRGHVTNSRAPAVNT